MILQLFNRIWAARHQFAKYFVIGVTSFVLDLGSLYLFARLTTLPHYAAVIISQPFILAYVFLMNKYWAFQSQGMTHRQLVRFLTLALANYIFATGWMWFFTEYFILHFLTPQFDYLVVRLVNVGLSITWNFILYKKWVYTTAAL